MKRVLYILMVLILCLQPMSAMASGNELTITVSQAQFCTGSVAQLEVTISGNPGYSHITANIVYDATNLKLTAVEPVNMHSMFAENVEANRVAAAGIDDMQGDGVMFILRFEVLQPGEHTVSVKLDSFGNAAGKTLDAAVIPGVIRSQVHSYQIYTSEPTCTQYGVVGRKCDICGEVEETERIPALGHTLENPDDVICKVCGKDTSQPDDEPTVTNPSAPVNPVEPPAKSWTWLTVLLIVLIVMVLVLAAVVIVLLRRRPESHAIPLPELDDLDDYYEEEPDEDE